MSKSRFGNQLAQPYQHQKFSNSLGVNQIGCAYAVQPEYLIHSVLDLVDIQTQESPTHPMLRDLKQNVR